MTSGMCCACDIVNVYGVERVEYHQRWPLKFNCEMSENSLTSMSGTIGHWYDTTQSPIDCKQNCYFVTSHSVLDRWIQMFLHSNFVDNECTHSSPLADCGMEWQINRNVSLSGGTFACDRPRWTIGISSKENLRSALFQSFAFRRRAVEIIVDGVDCEMI